jgi:cytochrome c
METGVEGSHAKKDLLEAGADMEEEEIEDQGLLSEEEDDDSPPIVLDFDAADAATAHQFVIIGRFLTVRGYNFMGLFETMKRAWRLNYVPDVKRLKDNCFLIELRSNGDKSYVLQGGPWIYRGDPFLTAAYDGKIRPSDVVLNLMLVWINIEDIPLNLMNEPTGKGRFWDDHMRIRVLMPVDKPLTRWLKVKDKDSGDMLRLHVKYERIPKFCRYCGHVGHVEKDCLLPKKVRRVRFGLHLRASPEKKFVTPNPDRQLALAKRNLKFDWQDDDRL